MEEEEEEEAGDRDAVAKLFLEAAVICGESRGMSSMEGLNGSHPRRLLKGALLKALLRSHSLQSKLPEVRFLRETLLAGTPGSLKFLRQATVAEIGREDFIVCVAKARLLENGNRRRRALQDAMLPIKA